MNSYNQWYLKLEILKISKQAMLEPKSHQEAEFSFLGSKTNSQQRYNMETAV